MSRETVETIGGHRFIRMKSGRLITFWDAISSAESRHTALGLALSRAFKLADDPYYLDAIEVRLDRLEEHLRAMRAYLEERRGRERLKDRIARLRNVEGRAPEEAREFLRKADELEAELTRY